MLAESMFSGFDVVVAKVVVTLTAASVGLLVVVLVVNGPVCVLLSLSTVLAKDELVDIDVADDVAGSSGLTQ